MSIAPKRISIISVNRVSHIIWDAEVSPYIHKHLGIAPASTPIIIKVVVDYMALVIQDSHLPSCHIESVVAHLFPSNVRHRTPVLVLQNLPIASRH